MADLKAAGAIIVARHGKETLFLVLRSSRHGEWGPPKGHAEDAENEYETACRELYEETGLRRITFDTGFREALAYRVERKGKVRQKEVVYFLGEIPVETEIHLSSEHTEYHLATLDEIEFLIAHEDMREVFRKANTHWTKRQAEAAAGTPPPTPAS